MAGGGSSGKTTTGTSNSEPWKAAQPHLKTSMGEAKNLFNAGIGSQPYQGSTVIPYSQQTMQGMGNIQNAANTAQSQGPYGHMSGSMDQLGLYASGQNLDGRNNPAFQGVLERTQQDTINAVNKNAAQRGRYGSGNHTANMTRELGDVTGRMLSDQYGNETRNMFQAQQMLPGAFNASMDPARAQMGVGGQYEDLATRMKNDELRLHDATQNAPWDLLSRYNAIVGGYGQMGGSTTQSQTTPGASGMERFGPIAGNALIGGMTGGWPGALAGGVSGIGGLFG
ncbi:MAG: hypothetical protein GY761_03230 [Hyphomicrobiales bacterium]|nr:hypothetical protein [Hyphomicrobiales bacterium]